MLEQSSVRAGFRSHATRRRAVAIALVVGSISLPLPGRPPATARKVRGSKAARGESVPNYGVIWEGKLTRSGQPRDERALAEARTYRGGDDLSPPSVAWLRRWAAAHTPGRYRLDPPADAIY